MLCRRRLPSRAPAWPARRESPAAPGRRGGGDPSRLPPGQYETRDFPVLSAGPTPRVSLDNWRFDIVGAVGQERGWSWNELQELPRESVTVDIHCVTKWSKFDTTWTG